MCGILGCFFFSIKLLNALFFVFRAVQMDNLEIVEMLINSMCDKNAKTDDGLTALHYAVAYRRYDICRFLLQERVKILAR